MIDFRSTRETRASSFDYIQVRIASPEEMRGPKDSKERERLGHIELAVPVAHIWFFKTLPSPMGNLVDLTLRDLEKVIYYSNYVVIDPGKQEVTANQLLDEDEFLNMKQKAKDENDHAFLADIGAPAVRELLRRINVDVVADEL